MFVSSSVFVDATAGKECQETERRYRIVIIEAQLNVESQLVTSLEMISMKSLKLNSQLVGGEACVKRFMKEEKRWKIHWVKSKYFFVFHRSHVRASDWGELFIFLLRSASCWNDLSYLFLPFRRHTTCMFRLWRFVMKLPHSQTDGRVRGKDFRKGSEKEKSEVLKVKIFEFCRQMMHMTTYPDCGMKTFAIV